MLQLRTEFDTGRPVQLTNDHAVNDVASLLKEYIRDLPDPLLSRDLYSAFLATAGEETTWFVCGTVSAHYVVEG